MDLASVSLQANGEKINSSKNKNKTLPTMLSTIANMSCILLFLQYFKSLLYHV